MGQTVRVFDLRWGSGFEFLERGGTQARVLDPFVFRVQEIWPVAGLRVRDFGPLYRRGLCAIFRKVAALPPRRAHACSTAHWTCSRSCVARCAASSSFFYRRHHSARRQCPELQWRGVSRALVCAAVAVKTCAWLANSDPQTLGRTGNMVHAE